VDFLAAPFGCQVIGLVDVLQRNGAALDEGENVDGLGGFRVGGADFLVGKHHVAALLVLHALDDVLAGDFLAGDLVDALVADRVHAALVQPIEVDALLRGGGHQADRYVHQAEADRAFPDGAWHGGYLPRPGSALSLVRVAFAAIDQARHDIEDEQAEQRTQQGQHGAAQTAGNADGGGQPDAGGGGQSDHAAGGFTFEYGPGTEKPHTGDDALDHPAQGILMGAGKFRSQHEQRTAHRHHHVGADAGRLAVVFPLIAEHCSEDGGHAQTENYAGDLFRVEDAAKFIGQGFYDAGPCPHSSSLPVPGSVSFAGTAATGLTQKDFASQVYADGLHPLTADE